MKIITVFEYLELIAVHNFTHALSNKYKKYFILLNIYERVIKKSVSSII